jgi:hypothetical protein
VSAKTGSTPLASAEAKTSAKMAKAKANGETRERKTQDMVDMVEPILMKRKVKARRSH